VGAAVRPGCVGCTCTPLSRPCVGGERVCGCDGDLLGPPTLPRAQCWSTSPSQPRCLPPTRDLLTGGSLKMLRRSLAHAPCTIAPHHVSNTQQHQHHARQHTAPLNTHTRHHPCNTLGHPQGWWGPPTTTHAPPNTTCVPETGQSPQLLFYSTPGGNRLISHLQHTRPPTPQDQGQVPRGDYHWRVGGEDPSMDQVGHTGACVRAWRWRC
jgi:hypothetical protein